MEVSIWNSRGAVTATTLSHSMLTVPRWSVETWSRPRSSSLISQVRVSPFTRVTMSVFCAQAGSASRHTIMQALSAGPPVRRSCGAGIPRAHIAIRPMQRTCQPIRKGICRQLGGERLPCEKAAPAISCAPLSWGRCRRDYFFLPVKSAVPIPKSSVPFMSAPATSAVILMSMGPFGVTTLNDSVRVEPAIVPLTLLSP